MTRTTTEREQLRAEHSDAWVAVHEGDSIRGTVIDVTEAWSDQRRDPQTQRPGSFYPLLTIRAVEATGYETPCELKVHGFGAVLFNEIMRKQPEIGEEVTITYRGVGEAKQNQSAPELYTVRGGGPQAAQRAYQRIGGRPAPAQGRADAPAPDAPAADQEEMPW